MPIRINNATRKPRENSLSHYGNGTSESMPSYPGKAPHGVHGGHRSVGFGNQGPPTLSAPGMTPSAPGMPHSVPGMPHSVPGMPHSVHGIPPMAAIMPAPVPNADSVRDDRGNPATKNLFMAGASNYCTFFFLSLLSLSSLTNVCHFQKRLRTRHHRAPAPGSRRPVCTRNGRCFQGCVCVRQYNRSK